MTNTPIHTHTDDRSELLSGYLDRALDVAAQRQAERTVAECAACAEELADLRALQTMLRALPAPMPRRSFTIDPATVRPRRLLFPIFRFASLVAAVLLFVVVGIDLGQGTPSQPMMTSMAERSTAPKEMPAAGGAAESAPYSAEEPTLEAPMAAMAEPAATSEAAAAASEPAADAPDAANTPEATTATEAAPAAAAPAGNTADATAAAESAADATGADTTNATAEADQMMPLEAPEAANGLAPREESTTVAGGAELLQQNDTAAGDTEQLTTTATEAYEPPIDLWRYLAYVMAVFVVGLGAAWWWTARRGI